MPNYNKVIQIGHLTRDPELRYSQAGTAFLRCGIAVNSGWGDRQQTCFTDFVIFGKRAEAFDKYLGKGDPVLIEGQLQLEEWQDKKTGDNRRRHSILVHEWGFVASKKEDSRPKAAATADPADPDIPF